MSERSRQSAMNIGIAFFVLFSTFFNSVAQFLLHVSTRQLGPFPAKMPDLLFYGLRLITNWAFLSGLSLYMFSMFSWIYVLSRLEVSYAAPMASLGFLFTAIIGYWIFGEQVTPMRILGIVVICCGIVIVSRS